MTCNPQRIVRVAARDFKDFGKMDSLTLTPVEIRRIKADRIKTPSLCILCFEEATTEALFELENALIARRYCDVCVTKVEY